MAGIYLGLGSNMDATRNLRLAVRELTRRFGEIALSPVYRSPAFGFEGDDFLNAVASLDSALAPDRLLQELEEIHILAGRERGGSSLTSRKLDIDLLLYGDLVVDKPGLRLPRKDILAYHFVLRPLADLAPRLKHPVTGRSMAEHWQSFVAGEGCGECVHHPLTEVVVDLHAH